MQVYNNKILPEAINQSRNANNQSPVNKEGVNAVSFSDVLNGKISDTMPLQFSKHASLRLSARNITLSTEQIKRVENGISKAREKGINESLVLVDSIALVVNVRSKTVVTAMNKEAENIFTNIDGAVIV